MQQRLDAARAVLRRRREILTRKLTENDLLHGQIHEIQKRIIESLGKLEVTRSAIEHVEDIAVTRRNRIKGRIEAVLTEAMRLVYGDDYHVELEYSVRANRSHLDVVLVRTTEEGDVRRTMGGFGGGVCDTLSVPLRLLVLLGAKQTDRVCLLDECYKHVDPERIDAVAQFLADISKSLDMQIVLLSHHEAMRDVADAAWRLREDGGRAAIEKCV